MENKLYTIQEIADICGVHYMTVRNWIKRGQLSVINLPGSGIRITDEELTRIITPATHAEPHAYGIDEPAGLRPAKKAK